MKIISTKADNGDECRDKLFHCYLTTVAAKRFHWIGDKQTPRGTRRQWHILNSDGVAIILFTCLVKKARAQ